MKKLNLFMCFVALFSAFSMVGCNGKIWDITPVDLEVYVVNRDGVNILDESYKGNILDTEIYMDFDGDRYNLGDTVSSRAIMPRFFGLTLDTDYGRSEPHLQFGEFDGAEDYTNEMTLRLGGQDYKIKIDRDFEWNLDGSPDGETTFYLDGKKVGGSKIVIEADDMYDDIIWDYAPVMHTIEVVDADGDNLLSAATDGNILSNDVSITLEGVKYGLSEDVDAAPTREILPVFEGLQLSEYPAGNVVMKFGEFEGPTDYDISMTLDLGVSETYELRYVRDFEHPDLLEQPIVEEEWYVNGEKMEEDIFKIIL